VVHSGTFLLFVFFFRSASEKRKHIKKEYHAAAGKTAFESADCVSPDFIYQTLGYKPHCTISVHGSQCSGAISERVFKALG
jgi:hypothetical protein